MRINFVVLNIHCLISKRTNKLNLQELRHIFENNDLLLLTETWTDEYSDISFPGFKVFWLSRLEKNRNSKRSSGGIAIYVRDKFYKTNMLFKQDSDDILWLRLEGCLFNPQYDVFVYLCYIVPADSSREINVCDRISDYILQIANETNNQYYLSAEILMTELVQSLIMLFLILL